MYNPCFKRELFICSQGLGSLCEPFVEPRPLAGAARCPRPSPSVKPNSFYRVYFCSVRAQLPPRAQAGRDREEGAARVGADAETDKNPLKIIITLIIMIMSEEFAVT